MHYVVKNRGIIQEACPAQHWLSGQVFSDCPRSLIRRLYARFFVDMLAASRYNIWYQQTMCEDDR